MDPRQRSVTPTHVEPTAIDDKILSMLRASGELGADELAGQLGMGPQACLQHLYRLRAARKVVAQGANWRAL